ncbi:MAG: hypothetical protein HZC36_15325 [Armatimonadetes bacterium]|nr:hypothetical protein [Armatimonadota bacterium]
MLSLLITSTIVSAAFLTVETLFVSALFGGLILSYLLLLGAGRFRFLRLRLPRFLAKPFLRVRFKASGNVNRLEALPGAVPMSLGLSVTGFGLFGLLLRDQAHWPSGASVLGALVLSLGLTTLFLTALARLFGHTATALSGEALVGKVAAVSLEIPSGGVGRIAYESDGKRHTMPARCESALGEQALVPGTRVFVVGLEKGIARVEEL